VFAKGPQSGYSVKKEALKLFHSAVCRKKESGSIKGFVVYPTKKDAKADRRGIASAGSSREAWEKAKEFFGQESISDYTNESNKKIADVLRELSIELQKETEKLKKKFDEKYPK